TAVFILIRGFDWNPEQLPDATLAATNSLFETIITALSAQQGIVDKFIGNGLFAVFRGEDHLARAVSACFAIRTAVATTTAQKSAQTPAQTPALKNEKGERVPELKLGAAIGLDSGRVL